MRDPESLYLCMGSACHLLGVDEILPKLQALLDTHGLSQRIVMKGHFCLNHCTEGVVARYGDQVFRHLRPETVERIFHEEMLPSLRDSVVCA
ncbi:MAG TPA: (2Fe-2S) ferredoxin domain-containing protein [Armatimonadota bacterium]